MFGKKFAKLKNAAALGSNICIKATIKQSAIFANQNYHLKQGQQKNLHQHLKTQHPTVLGLAPLLRSRAPRKGQSHKIHLPSRSHNSHHYNEPDGNIPVSIPSAHLPLPIAQLWSTSPSSSSLSIKPKYECRESCFPYTYRPTLAPRCLITAVSINIWFCQDGFSPCLFSTCISEEQVSLPDQRPTLHLYAGLNQTFPDSDKKKHIH